MSQKSPSKLALVLSGGGARGAYEAGVLNYIRTALPSPHRERAFDIICGSSVGAINTCFLAATADDLAFQGEEVLRLWRSVKEENIYERNAKAILSFLTRGSKSILFKMIQKSRKGAVHFPGFLNTAPFIPFLEKAIPWKNISRNIKKGVVQAISIVATNVATGRMELFIEKNSKIKYSGQHMIHLTQIQPIHAIASAAIPVIFPPILVNGTAYVDGGLRLNTPMSPAIQLGADSIFVIGLNHRATSEDKIPYHGEKGKIPSLGQVLGRVMNSVFLDKIQYDLEQLERINRIVEWCEEVYGKQFLTEINQMLEKKNIKGDVAERGLKKIRLLRIRPSEDIGEIFRHCYQRGGKKHFTYFEKTLIRLLDVDPSEGVDFLSYITFIPEYLNKLLELGFEDAKKHRAELKEFFES